MARKAHFESQRVSGRLQRRDKSRKWTPKTDDVGTPGLTPNCTCKSLTLNSPPISFENISVDPGWDKWGAGSNSMLKCPAPNPKFLDHKNANTHKGKGQPKDAKSRKTKMLELLDKTFEGTIKALLQEGLTLKILDRNRSCGKS